MLASVSYRYLKEKYGVISGSGAQAQNGNDARWNSEEIFAPFKGVAMIFRWGGPDFNSTYLHSLFNEFVCKLGFVWHEWAYECQKKPNLHTNALNTKLFSLTSPLKAPNRLKSVN
jgi:hypothetical protein